MQKKTIKYTAITGNTLILLALSLPSIVGAEEKVLDEVIVTGEIIDRPLSKTATSAEVLDEEELKKRPGLFTVRDVLNRTSNVTVVTGTGKAPTIRGIDGTGAAENANAFFAGSRPRLNWQIDGRPANYNEIVYGDIGIWDVERIEVLRGPQSTLTGRNSIAGSIIIKTNDPTFERETAFQAAIGNHDQRRGSAMANLPLNDVVSVRVAADWYESTSVVNYLPYEDVSDPGEKESFTIRGKMLIAPSPDTSLLLTVNHSKHKEPNGEIIVKPFGKHNSDFPQQSTHEPETTSFIAKFDTILSDTLSLEVNTSYTNFDFTRKSPVTPPFDTNLKIDTDEYAFEPRLRYEDDGGLTGVVGLYFFSARQDETIAILGAQSFEDKTDTAAIYTETVIPLGASFDLSLGLRYEHEKHKRTGGDGSFLTISEDKTFHALLPKFGLSWHPDDNATYGFQVSRGYNAGGGGITIAFPVITYQYDPEYVWNYELFGRQTFAGGKIKTTQNIFYARYKDMQLPIDVTPDDASDESFIVRNADEVETYGAELGLTYAINDEFGVYGNVGLLHTKITKFSNATAEGNDLLSAPSVTANAGVSWVKNGWSASLGGRYSSAYYSTIDNRSSDRTGSYFVADAQLAYDFKNVRIFGSVRNMFDSNKPVARTKPDTAVLLQPRTFLVGLQTSF